MTASLSRPYWASLGLPTLSRKKTRLLPVCICFRTSFQIWVQSQTNLTVRFSSTQEWMSHHSRFLYYFCLMQSFQRTLSLSLSQHQRNPVLLEVPFVLESGCKGMTFRRNTKTLRKKNLKQSANLTVIHIRDSTREWFTLLYNMNDGIRKCNDVKVTEWLIYINRPDGKITQRDGTGKTLCNDF